MARKKTNGRSRKANGKGKAKMSNGKGKPKKENGKEKSKKANGKKKAKPTIRKKAMEVQQIKGGQRSIEIELRDTVGVYLRLDPQDAPGKGSKITLAMGRWKTQLVVSHVAELKSGLIGIHAFVQPGKGDGAKLVEYRLRKAKLTWKC